MTIHLTESEQAAFLTVASVCDRLDRESDWMAPFFDAGTDWRDVAHDLREMVLYAKGTYQYEYPIGPDASEAMGRATVARFDSLLRDAVTAVANAIENGMAKTNQEYSSMFRRI